MACSSAGYSAVLNDGGRGKAFGGSYTLSIAIRYPYRSPSYALSRAAASQPHLPSRDPPEDDATAEPQFNPYLERAAGVEQGGWKDGEDDGSRWTRRTRWAGSTNDLDRTVKQIAHTSGCALHLKQGTTLKGTFTLDAGVKRSWMATFISQRLVLILAVPHAVVATLLSQTCAQSW